MILLLKGWMNGESKRSLEEGAWKSVLHRGQGVPLKGPFFAHFSQGILSEMNENAPFRVFASFGILDPTSLGRFDPALLGFLGRLAIPACSASWFPSHCTKCFHIESQKRIQLGLTGLEPATSPLSGVRSNQLSYKPK